MPPDIVVLGCPVEGCGCTAGGELGGFCMGDEGSPAVHCVHARDRDAALSAMKNSGIVCRSHAAYRAARQEIREEQVGARAWTCGPCGQCHEHGPAVVVPWH